MTVVAYAMFQKYDAIHASKIFTKGYFCKRVFPYREHVQMRVRFCSRPGPEYADGVGQGPSLDQRDRRLLLWEWVSK